MKFLITVFVAVAAFGMMANAAALDESTPLQTSGLAVATAVKTVTTLVTKLDILLNNHFSRILDNVTKVQELSINFQRNLTVGIATTAFSILDVVREVAEDYKAPQVKLLECISAKEDSILDIVDDAASKTGLCNNRLARDAYTSLLNRTVAIQLVTEELAGYADSLSKCLQGDVICLSVFGAEVTELVAKQATGVDGTIVAALKEVINAYGTMWGYDVPRCANEVFFPALKAGYKTIHSDIVSCVNAEVH